MKQIYYISVIFVCIGCNVNKNNSQNNNLFSSQNVIILDESSFLDSTWLPTQSDITETINCIDNFLTKPSLDNFYDSVSVTKILQNIKIYSAQFSGEYRNGRKVIWCNFFPSSDSIYINYDLKKIPHIVNDGGFYYWQVIYAIGMDKIINFLVNGKA